MIHLHRISSICSVPFYVVVWHYYRKKCSSQEPQRGENEMNMLAIKNIIVGCEVSATVNRQ